MIARCAKLQILILVLFIGIESFAATVLVRKDGTAPFSSINRALASLNPNDGVNDLILIGPGLYDEQLTPNGNASAYAPGYPNVFQMNFHVYQLNFQAVEASYTSHTDHLTLRGEDPNNPPILTYINGAGRAALPYGMYPDDPGANFYA